MLNEAVIIEQEPFVMQPVTSQRAHAHIRTRAALCSILTTQFYHETYILVFCESRRGQALSFRQM